MKTDSNSVRRTLGSLQPSAFDQGVLVGSGGKVSIDKKKLDTKRRRLNFDLENKPPVSVVGSKKEKELKSPKSSRCAGDERHREIVADPCNTVVLREAYELLLKDDATEEYWKRLAEERRIALEKALEENQKLHENLEIMEAENKHLQKIADHCAELADLVKTLTAEDEDDDDEQALGDEQGNEN